MSKSILYITYDGLTDPLGQSQILPYLLGLTAHGYSFHILSFEKAGRFKTGEEVIRKILAPANIGWTPLTFTSKPPLLSKFYDAVRMKVKAFGLQKKHRFDGVHCRSYIAADVGMALKKKFGIKFLFDMRSFWPDEKKDGNSWDQDKMIFRMVYKYYKKKEIQYLQNADAVVSLTEAAKTEMLSWPEVNDDLDIYIIPCCADMSHFSLRKDGDKRSSMELVGIHDSSFVLGYLGSLGAWYMLDEMLELFGMIKQKYPDAVFLFVTHSDHTLITSRLAAHGLTEKDVRIMEATRKQVPEFMKAADVAISFIKPVYSKISSSPTKIGELLAMGIPVICNGGIGDTQIMLGDNKAGVVISEFSRAEYERVLNMIPSLMSMSPSAIREKGRRWFDLENGVKAYGQMYADLFATNPSKITIAEKQAASV